MSYDTGVCVWGGGGGGRRLADSGIDGALGIFKDIKFYYLFCFLEVD